MKPKLYNLSLMGKVLTNFLTRFEIYNIKLCALAKQFLAQCQIAGGIYQIRYTFYSLWNEFCRRKIIGNSFDN